MILLGHYPWLVASFLFNPYCHQIQNLQTMRSFHLLLLSAAFLFACNENDGPAVCGVENPIEDLAWLKQEIENASIPNSSEYSFLMQATYRGQTVFYFGFCNPLWNWATILRDCQGNQMSGEVSLTDLVNEKVIWKPANSVCTFS